MVRLTRRKLLSATVGSAAALACLSFRQRAELHTITRTAKGLGASVSITALHQDQDVANHAISRAFDELREIEDVLSIYLPESQVSRLNRGGKEIEAHPHFLAVLEASQAMARRTDGAFDITVQPLWDLHFTAANNQRQATATEIETARRRVNWRDIIQHGNRVSLQSPGTQITFNGIAQGYATDRAAAILRSAGIQHALVDLGELSAIGTKDGQPWKVGIQHPRIAQAFIAMATLNNRCMATSGDYETAFSPDRASNHIFDPATGRSPTEFSSVSIAAPTAMQADALSTAVFVLGKDRGLELIRSLPGVDALFVMKDQSINSTINFPRQA